MRAAQARAVGHQVVGEQEHRQALEDHRHHGQRQPHGLVALRLDELLDAPVGIVELVDDACGSIWVPKSS